MIKRVLCVFVFIVACSVLGQNYDKHNVENEETIAQITSKYKATPFNSEAQTSLKSNNILLIPKNIRVSVAELQKGITQIDTSGLKNNRLIGRKKLVLLLPFNIANIESDTVNSSAMFLKRDKFLNMTLDFYAGALIAIDSAKSIGIPVDVDIFDSQETKKTSNIANIIQENNLQDADAVIGPFYQNNLEKTVELLSENSVPVISPLSKDIGNSHSNLFKSIPTNEILRDAMFDYMRAKGGNIIAVVDKKKESVRQYIQSNQKGVQFAALLPNGGLSVENLKSLFVKNKINYVILETTNTGLIKWTVNTMMGVIANFKVQLVVLEPNETLDTDEINFDDLTKLKLMYPSITRENESPEAKIFKKEYKNNNKISPSTYATRGFDLTFDTIMRLSQGNSFQETADTKVTEQVDNKFDYYKNEGGGYTNKGIYILYYDTDLTIKEAK